MGDNIYPRFRHRPGYSRLQFTRFRYRFGFRSFILIVTSSLPLRLHRYLSDTISLQKVPVDRRTDSEMHNDTFGLDCEKYLDPDCDIAGIGVSRLSFALTSSGSHFSLFPRPVFSRSFVFPPCRRDSRSHVQKRDSHLVCHYHRYTHHTRTTFLRSNQSYFARLCQHPFYFFICFDLFPPRFTHLATHRCTRRNLASRSMGHGGNFERYLQPTMRRV
jgi:hypothetical protein